METRISGERVKFIVNNRSVIVYKIRFFSQSPVKLNPDRIENLNADFLLKYPIVNRIIKIQKIGMMSCF